jgi:hypothetical protein
VNSNPRSIQDAVEEHKNVLSQMNTYGYSTTENQTVEMIIDSKGTAWVSFWGVWTGTFAKSGNKTEIIVITSRFVNGKIDQEHMYWDTAPFVLESIWVENKADIEADKY